jgi:hypothetical protein
MPEYLVELQTNSYPYDISHLRWNVHGDNGSPDEKVSDVVRGWNARYAYPQLIISTTAEAFRAFEAKYGNKLPEFSGDYTPYWEDGAGSSALETAMNRATDERLVQTEALWAIRIPGRFQPKNFMRPGAMLSFMAEHNWGAHNSINQPDLPFVRDQWRVKRGFALEADKIASQMQLEAGQCDGASSSENFEVFNTRHGSGLTS